MAELPRPFALPVIGNLHQLTKPPCLSFAQFGNVYGDVFQLKLGSNRTVILNSIEALRQAFDKQGDAFSYRDEKFTSFKLYKEVRGEENTGLTVRSADTDIWRAQHTLLRKAMKHYVFDSEDNRFEKTVVSETVKMVNTWLEKDKEADGHGGSLDPAVSFQRIIGILKAAYILGDVCDDIDDFDKKLDDYCEASYEMLTLMRSGFVNDFLPFFGFLTKSKQNRMRDVLSVGTRFFEDVYKAHQVSYQEGSKETIMDCIATFQEEMEKENPDGQRLPRKTVLGTIPELFEGVSNGSDALLQIMMYMVNFPDVQEKVRDELRGVVGTSSYPSLEHRPNLPFTEAVIYEVCRHGSVINGTVPHTCIDDVILGGSYNYFIPKGATVIGNLFAIHKDPNLWDRPEEFNPQRFIKQDGGSLDEEKVKNCTIFSVGKRRCVAEMIVTRELFLVYSTFIHLCKFENQGLALTMKEVGGFDVPRDGNFRIKISRTDVNVSST